MHLARAFVMIFCAMLAQASNAQNKPDLGVFKDLSEAEACFIFSYATQEKLYESEGTIDYLRVMTNGGLRWFARNIEKNCPKPSNEFVRKAWKPFVESKLKKFFATCPADICSGPLEVMREQRGSKLYIYTPYEKAGRFSL
jgi:hypothetical protein